MARKRNFDVGKTLVELASGGLVALDVIALLQTVGMQQVDIFQRISIHILVVAIPLLAFCFATTALTPPDKFVLRGYIYNGLDTGCGLSICAIGLLIAHVSLTAGMVFWVLSGAGVILLYYRSLY